MKKSIFAFVTLLGCSVLFAQGPGEAGQMPPSPNTPPTANNAPSGNGTAAGGPSGAQPAPVQVPAVAPEAVKKADNGCMVRVNVTNQPWDFLRPWGKRAPYSRRAVGAVLPDKRVLVAGELVANATYLEFETPEGGAKVPASVEVVDYEANLAILKADDAKFMERFSPAQFTTAAVGDTVSVWQFENTGTVLVTKGSMTTAEVSRYPLDDTALLVYRATVSLQFRDSSFTLPVARDDKLVGLMMRYDNNSKSAEIVPTPVIEHFLKDVADGVYNGFPKSGMAYSNTRDPQLRRYVGLEAAGISGGVYVTEVLKDGPADKAGITAGDVVLRINGEPVDQDGNYKDPVYGKIAVTHLVSCRAFDGDELKYSIFRKGQIQELAVKVAHRDPEKYVIEPYIIDRAPKFYVLGGLVLQELSRQFLKEWGPEWQKKAPEEFVFMDRQQNDLYGGNRKKIVVLGGVLPSPITVGYEELRPQVVTRINGVEINGIKDVAAALDKAENGLHKIEFDGDPSTIYLDAAAVKAGEAALMSNYRIPTLKRLE